MPKTLLNIPKYQDAMRYIISSLGEVRGKKKMYKLLYFLDFDFFEAYEKSFTGETYKKLEMGPAPVYFESVLSATEDIKVQHIRMSPYHENDTWIFKTSSDDNPQFSEEERKMLDRVVKKYGSMTGKQLENLSHAEAPWNAVDYNELIPYEYSIFRDSQDLLT